MTCAWKSRFLFCMALAGGALPGCGGGSGDSAAPPSTAPIPRLELAIGVPPGGFGNVDGIGDAARFNAPRGIAADSTGVLYVADSLNFAIRSVQPVDALVRTFAGSHLGENGFAEGAGTAARFGGVNFGPTNYPAIGGVALDSEGNVYLADAGNHRVRKITPLQLVSTFAGSGIAGDADGPSPIAQFTRPYHVAVDGLGSVYVADLFGGDSPRLRKVTRAGEVSTILPANPRGYRDGPAATALLGSIGGLAADSGGNLYISDLGNHVIRRLGSDGLVTTVAGRPGVRGALDGPRDQATLSLPLGLAIGHGGAIYVADDHKVRRVAASGDVSTVIDAEPLPHSGGCLSGVAISATGEVFVTDACRHVVHRAMPGNAPTTLAGRPWSPGEIVDGPAALARFQNLTSMVSDGEGGLVVIDNGNLRRISEQGEVRTIARDLGNLGIAGLALDEGGSAYLALFHYCGLRPRVGCVDHSTVRRIGPDGGTVEIKPSASSDGTPLTFRRIDSLARAPTGTLYISDQGANRVLKLDAFGNLTTLAGNVSGAIALDRAENAYVVDSGNRRLLRITPAGSVSTRFAGFVATTPGAGPDGIAVDAAGNVYIAQTHAHAVWKVSPSGSGAVVVGQILRRGFLPDRLPALLDAPLAVAVSGNDLWISQGSALAVVRNRP